ncbi:MAG: hypothetical protein IKQ35_05125 [Bacilli bacterium]|nr:hypothetical protein [Bacilli bacterium]
MKKVLICLLSLVLVISITGCGNNKKDNKEAENKKENNEIVTSNNSVVLYFSATGTTKIIANKIAKESNSDIIEIIPKEEYKKEDLDYNNDCRANREQNDDNARPEIKNDIDISKYDTIFLGYPIWWGTNPKIILTLLDKYDFTGKTIIPFCTSGSSDIKNSVNDLRNYKSDLIIKDGKRFSGSASDEEIKSFINENINISNDSKEVINSVKTIINKKEYKIVLEDNETAKSFVNLLPKEFTMSELNGNEKYIYLDNTLPTNASNPKRINAGDVMLYGNNCLVIFYKSFDTSYSYTKIGHIDNLPNLGNGNITVRFER